MKKYSLSLFVLLTVLSCSSSEQGYLKVTKVYVNEMQNTIYFDTDKSRMNVLDQDENSVFQIVETTEDNQWVIVIEMSAEAHEGRVETIYNLYNTFIGDQIDHSLLEGHTLLGFENTDTDIILITESDRTYSLNNLYELTDK
jgi:hypothetical protein